MKSAGLERHPKLWLWLTVGWMAVLFVLSTSFFSAELTKNIDFPINIRLLAHICVYLVLGFLASRAVDLNFPWKNKILITFLICILYAISDELHQHFEPARHGRLIDVIVDSVSAFFGIVGQRLVYQKRFVGKGT